MVTAAHCQFSVSRFLVVLGEHDLEEDEDEELRMVPTSWLSHPLYNSRSHHQRILRKKLTMLFQDH